MRPLLLLALLLVASVAGCGPKPDQEYTLKLSVTLDGAPLCEGSVYVLPADCRNAAGGELVDGKVEARTVPGTHRVEVRAYLVPPGTKVPAGAKPGQLVPDPFVNYIPSGTTPRPNSR